MKKLIEEYGILYDNEAKNGIELKYLSDGYVFNKKPSFDVEVESVKEVSTLFSENDNMLEKILKVLEEYRSYGTDDEAIRDCQEVVPMLRVVKVLNEQEMKDFAKELLSQDKAIDTDIVSYLVDFVELKDIKNKEARIIKILQVENPNGIDLIRYVDYLATGSTLFINIKGDNIEPKIENKEKIIEVLDRNYFQLAKVFNTYKKTFMWLKKAFNLTTQINRIGRLSKKVVKYNLAVKYDLYNEDFDFGNAELSYLLRLYQLMIDKERPKQFIEYKIRNGKSFVKDLSDVSCANKAKPAITTTELKEIIQNKIDADEEITKESYIKDGWILSTNTSDKKMSGGIPFGSKLKLQEGDKIGIDWKGHIDYDISLINAVGDKIGWNSAWVNNYLSYSGDCTTAGSELFTVKKLTEDNYIFYCNYFSSGSDQEHKFRIIVIRDGKTIYESSDINLDKGQLNLGYYKDNYFVLDITKTKSSRVAEASECNADLLKKEIVYPSEIFFEKED